MSERPILFSAPMERALLEGRKTQTRRVVKWNNHAGVNLTFSGLEPDHLFNATWALHSRDGAMRWQERANAKCPLGKPGDRLWVREGTVVHASIREQLVGYTADGCSATEAYEKQMPSIHMRRAHSRLTLEVTEVRVQRLQDINEEDAVAEGLVTDKSDVRWDDPRRAYRELWELINGEGSWDLNPWVWAVSFKAVRP